MNKCAWKYYSKFIIRNLFLIFGILGSIEIVLFVADIALKKNIADEIDLIIFFLSLGLIIFILSNLFLIKFYLLIKRQREEYKIDFNDTNAKKIFHLVYLTDDWLIDCGTLAILRKTITKTYCYEESSVRGGSAIKIEIYVSSGKKYHINVRDQQDVDTFKLWASYSKYSLYDAIEQHK